MSEPIYYKHEGAPVVVVYARSQAALLEANGWERCDPDPDAIPAPPVPVQAVTANIRSDSEPEPEPVPTPEEPGGEYTPPPAKPKAKAVKK